MIIIEVFKLFDHPEIMLKMFLNLLWGDMVEMSETISI